MKNVDYIYIYISGEQSLTGNILERIMLLFTLLKFYINFKSIDVYCFKWLTLLKKKMNDIRNT